ncbi:MAG TPA: YetF domain-containing protein [Myxococcaceae bacterium]|jgi:uncharacterized membrane protein YcaP (DUF421 family)
MKSDVAFLFAGWQPILRILFVGTFAYLSLLVTLRVSGSRTLARTNVFDFIISVTIGSVFGRILTAKEVALAEACVAFALLALLQYLVSWLRIRSSAVAALVDGSPVLLYFDGAYAHRAMRAARIAESDLQEAVRAKGISSLTEVEAVILEAGGAISILRKSEHPPELISRLRSSPARTERSADAPSG